MTKNNDLRTFPASVLSPLEANTRENEGVLSNLIGAELGDTDPFFWTAEISSDRLDSYFTHMAESTLRNFANNAAAGVMFLDSHNTRSLGYGQSLSGTFEVNGDVSRVVSDFYTVPGIRFRNGPTYESTDDFIKAVKARLVRDVSVGFYDGDMICDICGNSFYDYQNCQHWPGQEYAVGDKGEQTVVATFSIEDANLAEVSGVYDGATPQAQIIQRAQEVNEAGKLEPETARALEVQYRIKLQKGVWSPGITIKSDERRVDTMPDETNEGTNETAEDLAPILALLAEANAEGESALEQVRWLVSENARLAPLADQGRQYHDDLVADALAEGVRAMGNDFPTETYENMFRSATIDHIKEIRSQWQKLAAERLNGGRHTVDDDQTETPQPAPVVPRSAYKS